MKKGTYSLSRKMYSSLKTCGGGMSDREILAYIQTWTSVELTGFVIHD